MRPAYSCREIPFSEATAASGPTGRKREPIVHCAGQILLAADVSFGGLDGCMSQQELDLLKFAARGVAQAGASPSQVVGGEFLDSDAGRAVLHNVPDDILGDPVAPDFPVLSN